MSPSDWLAAEKAAMMQRLDKLPGSDDAVRGRASERLASRLAAWWGSSDPVVGEIRNDVIKTKIAYGDPAELLVVRAIATTLQTADFGLTRSGAVYSTKGRNSSGSGFHVFVNGLSPLIDGAGVLLRHQMTGHATKFCESDTHFVAADGETLFKFLPAPDPPLWRRVLSAIQFWQSQADPLFEWRGQSNSHPKNSGPQTSQNSSPHPAPVVQQVRIDSPNPGVLKQMGYTVGKSGLSQADRRAVLRDVHSAVLIPSAQSRAYVAEWGSAGSSQRLDKMIRCLRAFIDTAQRHQADYSSAIANWEEDLVWLQRAYT